MKNEILKTDVVCRICKGEIETVINFKPTPFEDDYIGPDLINKEQPLYTLDLAICKKCGYLHLPDLVSPEVTYKNYVYVSAVTVGLRNHYDAYAKEIVDQFQIKAQSLVVDLGSNDGSMLSSFKKIGMKVVGIEPATNISKQANLSGIETINDFFTQNVVAQIKESHGPANVITANYMFANVDDLLTFTRNVEDLLDQEGIFVIETGYHPEQFKIQMFDYIYHEHFSYFSVEVLKNIFSLCGLELIHVEKTTPKGGSIRVVGQKIGSTRNVDNSVQILIDDENRLKIREPKYFSDFKNVLEAEKIKLLNELTHLKYQNKKIVGFGASHSVTTILFHFELSTFIKYLVDDNKIKQGLFSPHLHLPVFSTEKLYEDKPDVILLLAWQHQKTILERHKKYLENGGIFIVPLPNFKIIKF